MLFMLFPNKTPFSFCWKSALCFLPAWVSCLKQSGSLDPLDTSLCAVAAPSYFLSLSTMPWLYVFSLCVLFPQTFNTSSPSISQAMSCFFQQKKINTKTESPQWPLGPNSWAFFIYFPSNFVVTGTADHFGSDLLGQSYSNMRIGKKNNRNGGRCDDSIVNPLSASAGMPYWHWF